MGDPPQEPRSSAPVFSPRERPSQEPRHSYQGPERMQNRFPQHHRPRHHRSMDVNDHLSAPGGHYHIPGYRQSYSNGHGPRRSYDRNYQPGPTVQDVALAQKLLAQMQVLEETRKLDVTSDKLRKINAALRMEVQDLKQEVRNSAEIRVSQSSCIQTLQAQLRAQDHMIQGLYRENGQLLKQAILLRESEERLLRDSCAAVIDLRPSMGPSMVEGQSSKESLEGEIDLVDFGLPNLPRTLSAQSLVFKPTSQFN